MKDEGIIPDRFDRIILIVAACVPVVEIVTISLADIFVLPSATSGTLYLHSTPAQVLGLSGSFMISIYCLINAYPLQNIQYNRRIQITSMAICVLLLFAAIIVEKSVN